MYDLVDFAISLQAGAIHIVLCVYMGLKTLQAHLAGVPFGISVCHPFHGGLGYPGPVCQPRAGCYPESVDVRLANYRHAINGKSEHSVK